MSELPTPLPTLTADALGPAWSWPLPSALARLAPAGDAGARNNCRVETPNGVPFEGEVLDFDAESAHLRFRIGTGAPLTLPFKSFRRLTLTDGWELPRRARGAPIERINAGTLEREVRVELVGGGNLVQRSVGHVEEALGLFLYVPDADAARYQRVFIPRSAYTRIRFSTSEREDAEAQAANHWVSTSEALLVALEREQTVTMMPMGEALMHLGLVTRAELAQALAQQAAEGHRQALGDLLVANGLIGDADLQTALAHKMGCPLVDLGRFPVDVSATRKLSYKTAVEYRALPLLLDGQCLIVAVDSMAGAAQLRSLRSLAQLKIVPVLACRGRIALAQADIARRLGLDVWAEHVPVRATALGAN